jgi:hypothetical protein
MEVGDKVLKLHLKEILRVMKLHHLFSLHVNIEGKKVMCFNSKPETIDTFYCTRKAIEQGYEEIK